MGPTGRVVGSGGLGGGGGYGSLIPGFQNHLVAPGTSTPEQRSMCMMSGDTDRISLGLSTTQIGGRRWLDGWMDDL